MITEALRATAGSVGFRDGVMLDDSQLTHEKTRFAIARAKTGDRDAVRYLYVTYAQNVYGYVRTIVRDDHEAEDVTQQVFAKLLTVIVKYDDRGIPFAGWLLRLARNLAIDHLRANRLTPVDEVVDPQAPAVVDLDHSQVVRSALAALPPEQREVVVLRHLGGFTPAEIAGRIGRTESSVHGLHHRGRRALRHELQRLDAAPATRPARPPIAA